MIFSSLDIIDEWHGLILECQGEGPGVLAAVEDSLDAIGIPGVGWSRESVAVCLMACLFNRTRDFLVVTFDAFPRHRILIGFHDYGSALGVSFFVVWVPSAGERLQRALVPKHAGPRRESGAGGLDAFAVSDLTAAISAVRHAFDETVANLTTASDRAVGALLREIATAEPDSEG